jgi:hypothetical protein
MSADTTAESDTSGPSWDYVSAAGKIYQSMVSDLLATELDRRKTLEGRGATLVTTSGSLVTLIFGLTVFVAGKDPVFTNHYALIALCCALLALVISGVLAIVVQTYGFKYDVVDCDSLKKLAGTNEAWAQWPDHAVRADVSQHVKTICSLRNANAKMANLIIASLAVQVLAIFLLALSVGLDLYLKL